MSVSSIPGTQEAVIASDDSKRDALRPTVNIYAELKNLIKAKGLLDKQPVYYTRKILTTVGLLLVGVAFLVLVNNVWLQFLNAAYLAFVFSQIGFLGHDAGHRQIFNATWKNDLVMLLEGNLLIGMSYNWWMEKHNKHHSHPNQLDMDPDIDIPFISFSQEDALTRRYPLRFIVKYQAFFFFFLLLFVGIELELNSFTYVVRTRGKNWLLEVGLLVVHYALYFGLIFTHLNLWQGIVFILIHQTLFGLYLGSTFAPNHKGMPIIEKASKMDFLRRQVLTARNVYSSPFNDYWYGGLNYQIEHHLFPSMPRKNLKEAQKTIRAFCRERCISYYETSMGGSYKDILVFLHQISAPLRHKRA